MWSETSWAVFDTETTGFGPDARILEIAVVTFDEGKPVREWSQLLNPEGVNWNESTVKRALAVNGINPADLEGKPKFQDILSELLLELSSHVWVAHNLEFDQRMLTQELKRLGKTLLAPQLPVCTLLLAAHLDPGARSHKLQEVASRYGVKQAGAHRAAVDALTCGEVLVSMLRQGRLPREDSEMTAQLQRAAVTWKNNRRY